MNIFLLSPPIHGKGTRVSIVHGAIMKRTAQNYSPFGRDGAASRDKAVECEISAHPRALTIRIASDVPNLYAAVEEDATGESAEVVAFFGRARNGLVRPNKRSAGLSSYDPGLVASSGASRYARHDPRIRSVAAPATNNQWKYRRRWQHGRSNGTPSASRQQNSNDQTAIDFFHIRRAYPERAKE